MTALKNFPLVCAGDDLCELVAQGLACDAIHLQFGDILVVAQKVVSKAEGRNAKRPPPGGTYLVRKQIYHPQENRRHNC